VWGENDFGLDPSSNSCEKVDGIDRPWCFTDEDAWDYCACETTSAQRKDDTLKVSTGRVDGPSRDEGSEVQAGEKINFKDLMLQGKVTRWWWDSLNLNTERLTDVNFDAAITRSDYYAVFFYSPFCASCKDLSVEWDKLAATFARTRTDTAFGRVNCGHGDQTYRPPTEEELDAGDPAAWGEYKDSNVRLPFALLRAPAHTAFLHCNWNTGRPTGGDEGRRGGVQLVQSGEITDPSVFQPKQPAPQARRRTNDGDRHF
jgi:hypothetical protein